MALRPLTARSVVASTLLGVEPPVLPARLLVRSGELFGIAEGTTRVALSRMVAAGELVAGDGSYRLAGHLLARQASQQAARHPVLRRWDGSWRVAVVTAAGRSAPARASLRTALDGARMAERREGVWMRPDNLAAGEGVDLGETAGHCEWWTARPDSDPVALASSLWDLDGWAAGAAALLGAMDEHVEALEAGDAAVLAETFMISAAVLRHLRRDPLLPGALLPDEWAGDRLRSQYDRFDEAFKSLWRDWFRAQHPVD